MNCTSPSKAKAGIAQKKQKNESTAGDVAHDLLELGVATPLAVSPVGQLAQLRPLLDDERIFIAHAWRSVRRDESRS